MKPDLCSYPILPIEEKKSYRRCFTAAAKLVKSYTWLIWLIKERSMERAYLSVFNLEFAAVPVQANCFFPLGVLPRGLAKQVSIAPRGYHPRLTPHQC